MKRTTSPRRGPLAERSAQSEKTVEHLIPLLNSARQDIFLAALANSRAPEDILLFLSDLLTDDELNRIVNRFVAVLSFVAAGVAGLPETTVVRELNLNYTTYTSAKSRAKVSLGGINCGLAAAKRSFSELRILPQLPTHVPAKSPRQN